MNSTNHILHHTGKRFAISDIHGCANTFIALLEKIAFTHNDTLYILGDMISRGKRSKKTIKTILSLQNDGYSVIPIRGNHEQFIISEFEKNDINNFYTLCKRMKMLWLFEDKNTMKIKHTYKQFFLNLPYYISLENILLSHAGFDFSSSQIFENTYAMLNQRSCTHTELVPDSIKVIHGHTPISIEKIKRSILSGSPIINIDNGCVYKSNSKQRGNLVCIDIDNFDLYIQKNIE